LCPAAVVAIPPRSLFLPEAIAPAADVRVAPESDTLNLQPGSSNFLLASSPNPRPRTDNGGDEGAQVPPPVAEWPATNPIDDPMALPAPEQLPTEDAPRRPHLPALEEVPGPGRPELPIPATTPPPKEKAESAEAALVMGEAHLDSEVMTFLASSVPQQHTRVALPEDRTPTSARMYLPPAVAAAAAATAVPASAGTRRAAPQECRRTRQTAYPTLKAAAALRAYLNGGPASAKVFDGQ
jgi:hypothetical protein